MIRVGQLQPWFKPRCVFEYRGARWATNGCAAVAVDDSPMGKAPENMSRFDSALDDPGHLAPPEPERVNGFCIVGQVVVSQYYFDLVAEAYPGGTWFSGDRWIRRVEGGATVAAVMGTLHTPTSVRDASPCEPPDCPVCEGHGGAMCKECDGDGQVEHQCECGDLHECECEKCDGTGSTQQCSACAGTGHWAAASKGTVWTDYPIASLGDGRDKPAPIREVEVIAYDGDKYCDVKVPGLDEPVSIKAGYLYTRPGRYFDEPPTIDTSTLPRRGAQ